MRAVVQRVSHASVQVAGQIVGAIDQGLVVLLGVGEGDTENEAHWLAHKIANLRIFSDTEGKMNLSVKTMGGQILVISQFTLYGDPRRGFRPSFAHAAPPDIAEPLVEVFIADLKTEDVPVATGIFQAHMSVELVNDGPVTILLEKNPTESGLPVGG
ncbi:MAG: D-tyrosyl-tRNA(Tyr) deacylase [Anaerolineae bacterium]|nr:D-tyrosyl-tRNA(Tyr) deacylase [Anaerolineae bacterium]